MPNQSPSPSTKQHQKERQQRLKEEYRKKQRDLLLQKRMEEQQEAEKHLFRRPATPASESTVSSVSSYDDWSQPFPRRPMSRLNGKKPLKLDFPKTHDTGRVTGGVRLDLNLAAEIRVHASVHGDLTLALLG